MRIVLDLEPTQAHRQHSRAGGQGLSLVRHIVENSGEHEIFLVLSAAYPETIEPIRAVVEGALHQERICVWHPADSVAETDEDSCLSEAAALLRGAFLASLKPDIVHILGPRSVHGAGVVASIPRYAPELLTGVHVGDLPMLGELNSDGERASLEKPFLRKTSVSFKGVALCTTTSAASRRECVERLGLAPKVVVDASEGVTGVSSEQVARNIIQALENTVAASNTDSTKGAILEPRPRLAFVSPLPPEKTGIASYSTELLPELAKYYDLEIVVCQEEVSGRIEQYGWPTRNPDWLRDNLDQVDRVLYQFGNSSYHGYMLELIGDVPGTVTLHDFFLGDLMAADGVSINAASNRGLLPALYRAHGYPAVCEFHELGPVSAIRRFPANWDVLSRANGVIVHSAHSCRLAEHWYGERFASEWQVIPHLREEVSESDRVSARKMLGVGSEEFLVCSFGMIGETKLSHELLDAWLELEGGAERNCRLVFVGENSSGEYGSRLCKKIRENKHLARVEVTGWADEETFDNYLAAADVAVQLRTHSRGETSGTVLDAMARGLPLVINAHGSMGEIPTDAVWMLADDFDAASLRDALETLRASRRKRDKLGQRARAHIRKRHSPSICARKYRDAVEEFHRENRADLHRLFKTIADTGCEMLDDTHLVSLAGAIDRTFPAPQPAKQLLVDVSAICRTDLKTGIQRVVRALLLAMLTVRLAGYRVEPVYLSDLGGQWHYRYAHGYMQELLSGPSLGLADDSVTTKSGDVLLALDLSGDMLVHAQEQAELFSEYRNRGLSVYAVVYDLLPVLMPGAFPESANSSFLRWLRVIGTLDGAFCISKAVADELSRWYADAGISWTDRRPYRIDWFHLGADVSNSAPSRGLPRDAKRVLGNLRARPTFLMVGTIEPRKGHLQALEAFTKLWDTGLDVNLVIIGKAGWKGQGSDKGADIPSVVKRIQNHPELHTRLFWLEGISDEYLENVYAASSCLVAASFGEGFGLPLVEAAQHGKPIIARDIPVFREVAGDFAFYFQAEKSSDMSAAIREWLSCYEQGQHPKSDALPWLTWKESAEQLLDRIGIG